MVLGWSHEPWLVEAALFRSSTVDSKKRAKIQIQLLLLHINRSFSIRHKFSYHGFEMFLAVELNTDFASYCGTADPTKRRARHEDMFAGAVTVVKVTFLDTAPFKARILNCCTKFERVR